MNGYVAACGQWTPSHRAGRAHERSCLACADAIAAEDEGFIDDAKHDDDEFEEDDVPRENIR